MANKVFESAELSHAIAVINGKWKVMIIWHLLSGKKRFSELLRLLPGISRGTLAYELQQLQADGVIQRTQYPTIPATVEYALTARGRDLEPVLTALSQWGQKRRGTKSER